MVVLLENVKFSSVHGHRGSQGEHPCEHRALATATSTQVNTVKN